MLNSLIIFDLDGVLIDSKDIHFSALNLALSRVSEDLMITREEQDSTYEGLTTKAKLKILTETKGLSESSYDEIWKLKQEYSSILFMSTSRDPGLVELFNFIKASGVSIGVASNSIRKTLDLCLRSLGIADMIDYSLSNEDVSTPKPNPEIYNRVMNHFSISPKDTVIFEDSQIGIAAAQASGARVEVVKDRSELTMDRIFNIVGNTHEA
jgi:HAD superfamily hydrolase (TIGR01509 family)